MKTQLQYGRTAPSLSILSPHHLRAPLLLEDWLMCQGQAKLTVPLAVPTQGEPQSRIQTCRSPEGSSALGTVQGRAFLTVVAGAGNAAPHPLVRGASLAIGGQLRHRAADGWGQESRARRLNGIKIWGAESELAGAGGGRGRGGAVGMPVLLGRGVGRGPGRGGLPVVQLAVNARHMVVAGEVRVLRRARHVVLGVEVEAGVPDGAGIHVGVLIHKISQVHLRGPAPRSCCAAEPLCGRPGSAGGGRPSFGSAHLGALGSCPGARHLPAHGLLLGPTSRSICIERQVCISKCRNPSG